MYITVSEDPSEYHLRHYGAKINMYVGDRLVGVSEAEVPFVLTH